MQPRGAPQWPPLDTITVLYQPFAISSFAMSLLMVFRTNSSYARWWEARTVWGQIYAVSRNLTGQVGWLAAARFLPLARPLLFFPACLIRLKRPSE